jgi:O-antigen ligase
MSPKVQDRLGPAVGNIIEYGSPSPKQEGDENVSNVTRLAAIRAGLSMFREHPYFGVGFGQFGFNYPDHLRADDFRSYEVRTYVTEAEEAWPPSYSIHARMLAETGLFGYLTWLSMILTGIWRGLANADVETENGRAHIAVAMTLIGWLLLGASIDSFRFFGGWIAVGVGFALSSRNALPWSA